MDIDPNSFDPELRFAKIYATASAALGVISLCAGVIPICGGISGLFGIAFGVFSLRTEKSRLAQMGIGFSVLGMITSVTYYSILVLFGQ